MTKLIENASIPLAVDGETGHLRLIPRSPVCHGYANVCVCAECRQREKHAKDGKPPAPRQPWQPRPPESREAA